MQRFSTRFSFFISFVFGAFFSGFSQKPSTPYFPPAHTWTEKTPAEMGLNPAKIQEAIAFAKAGESKNPRSMEQSHYQSFGKEPFGFAIGPFNDRGDQTGIIVYKGYIIAQWGEPSRCDITHSVTKSFLSSVVGVAVDKGLIRSVNDTVASYVPPIELYGQPVQRPADDFGKPELLHLFDTPHNRRITWDNMLRQTSDWEGTLWGKPDWADRPDADASKWLTRPRNAPGSVYEYNDVRVNALALAAASVWRKPLPQVLKEQIMDPIGASNTWRWTGYRNAWIVLDGQPVQSVSGGGHWGGGMFINAYDMARFGLLTLHRGNWNGKQLLSEQWVKQATTPTPAQPTYGYMNWFLNTGQKPLPSASANVYYHVGNGTNIVFVDPDHELVMVVRWIENNALDGIVKRVLEAFTPTVPDTDIYLTDLKGKAGAMTVGKPVNVTKRPGYDNQPSFTPDGKKLLYTQQANGQTDIWTYDLEKKTNTTLTKTTESEYSATVMPDGKHFSVIRVEPDGMQRLWQFDLATGKQPTLVLPSIKPVGYHCWYGADSLVLFVLGQPNTLQLARVSTGQGQIITNNVGRSLLRIPSQKAVSFVHKLSASEWQVEALDMSTLQTEKLIQTPSGSEDCAWVPDGTLLMAQGAKLYQWNPKYHTDWQLLADWSSLGIKQITRLSVNPKGTQLAFVGQ
ncbi:MAG: serine hydrolase [Spirosomataceae bacterium]